MIAAMGASMRSGEWPLKPPVTKPRVMIKATARRKSAARINGGPPRQSARSAMAGIKRGEEDLLLRSCMGKERFVVGISCNGHQGRFL